MTTNNIPSAVSSSSSSSSDSPSRAQDRARLADLAAEFESMLLVNVLRDMRSSGRWNADDAGADMLGAETFDQTIDVELSRYLSKAGGFGLSQRLLSAFDALARVAESAASAGGDAAANAATDATVMSKARAASTSGSMAPSISSASTRTGWNGMRLDAPANGGSGAEWAGFNNDRALAGGDDSSVKDAFFRWTYGLSFNPAGKSKEEVTSYLRDNVQSARDYGLTVLDVRGDQILVETEESGPEWVDVVQSAGSAQAKWQWLCQSEFGVEPGGGELGAALRALRSSADGDSRARSLLASSGETGDALLASLRAETASPGSHTSTAPRVADVAPATPEALRSLARAVTSSFGWRQDPFNGTTSFHQGVDLRAAEGDPVESTGAGRVMFSGADGGYGTSVVVQHANGLTTRYAHLSEALVGVGEQVEDGQVLGLAGQTGRATGPHLHYEVRVDGRAVDPQ